MYKQYSRARIEPPVYCFMDKYYKKNKTVLTGVLFYFSEIINEQKSNIIQTATDHRLVKDAAKPTEHRNVSEREFSISTVPKSLCQQVLRLNLK